MSRRACWSVVTCAKSRYCEERELVEAPGAVDHHVRVDEDDLGEAPREDRVAEVQLAAGRRQVLREVRALRGQLVVLAAIDDRANAHAAVERRPQVLEDLGVLEHADQDPDLALRAVDGLEVELPAIVGQHGDRARAQPGGLGGLARGHQEQEEHERDRSRRSREQGLRQPSPPHVGFSSTARRPPDLAMLGPDSHEGSMEHGSRNRSTRTKVGDARSRSARMVALGPTCTRAPR